MWSRSNVRWARCKLIVFGLSSCLCITSDRQLSGWMFVRLPCAMFSCPVPRQPVCIPKHYDDLDVAMPDILERVRPFMHTHASHTCPRPPCDWCRDFHGVPTMPKQSLESTPPINIPANADLPLSPSIAHLPTVPWPWEHVAHHLLLRQPSYQDILLKNDWDSDAGKDRQLQPTSDGGKDLLLSHANAAFTASKFSIPVVDVHQSAWANATCQKEGCKANNVTHGQSRIGREGRHERVWGHVVCTLCAAGDARYLPLKGIARESLCVVMWSGDL